MVEVARLESVYRFIAYPGFESPSLRQVITKNAPFGAFFISRLQRMWLPSFLFLFLRALTLISLLQAGGFWS